MKEYVYIDVLPFSGDVFNSSSFVDILLEFSTFLSQIFDPSGMVETTSIVLGEAVASDNDTEL